jgi:hypothetical protein
VSELCFLAQGINVRLRGQRESQSQQLITHPIEKYFSDQ